MFENIKLAFQGIWGHKMRSLLTMLGIIIGIASIISIVSTIKGTNEQIKKNLVGAGNNSVTIKLYQGEYPYEMEWGSVPDNIPVITDTVRTQIVDIPEVEDASLYTERTYVYNTYYNNVAFNGAIRGVDSHYLKVNGYEVLLGRDFSDHDFETYRKVALVDSTAAQTLFGGQNPIGKTLEISSEPFVVIGMVGLAKESQLVINSMQDYDLYMGNSSGMILVPGIQWSALYRYDEPQCVVLTATSTDDMTGAGQKAQNLLNQWMGLNEESEMKYQSDDISQQAKNLQAMTQTTNMQLIWIASISLLVGGIGVMNIMLVSVTERTREIGLKKAIGARESRILWQFLTEAAVLTSLGGIIGVGAGVAMSRVISQLTGTPTAISLPAILVAVIFSMLIGVVFGLLPAIKAARLNPIDALRRE